MGTLELFGLVRDVQSGEPVVGATVAVCGASSTTDAEGRFTLQVDEKMRDDALVVVVSADLFSTNVVPVRAVGVDRCKLPLYMKRYDTRALIGPSRANLVPLLGGGMVRLPRMTDLGERVAEVEVLASSFDVSTKEVLAAPGSFRYDAESHMGMLRSYGVFDLKIRDAKLGTSVSPKFRDAEPILVVMPTPGGTIKAPDHVPLWKMNESTGMWLREGWAFRTDNGYGFALARADAVRNIDNPDGDDAALRGAGSYLVTFRGKLTCRDVPVSGELVYLMGASGFNFKNQCITNAKGEFLFDQAYFGADLESNPDQTVAIIGHDAGGGVRVLRYRFTLSHLEQYDVGTLSVEQPGQSQ